MPHKRIIPECMDGGHTTNGTFIPDNWIRSNYCEQLHVVHNYLTMATSRATLAWLGAPLAPSGSLHFARDMEIVCPGECSARLAAELGAGPASANTARPCFAGGWPRGRAGLLWCLSWSNR
ncbi:hypothetical protein GQ600_23476 [Phytophthora cactorum]|nr:hypothetical protein GQ600_23476 [Phytophthora cactorum]